MVKSPTLHWIITQEHFEVENERSSWTIFKNWILTIRGGQSRLYCNLNTSVTQARQMGHLIFLYAQVLCPMQGHLHQEKINPGGSTHTVRPLSLWEAVSGCQPNVYTVCSRLCKPLCPLFLSLSISPSLFKPIYLSNMPSCVCYINILWTGLV